MGDEQGRVVEEALHSPGEIDIILYNTVLSRDWQIFPWRESVCGGCGELTYPSDIS